MNTKSTTIPYYGFMLLLLFTGVVSAVQPPDAGQNKVDICHYDELSQSWALINIAERAVPAHVANHDDCVEPGCMTDSGVFLNDACEVTLATYAFGSAAIFGDPHFQTWDGLKFDFQGLGVYDAMLVSGGSPHVQLMTRELAQQVTAVWGVAIAVAGGDVVEIEATLAGSTPLVYVNSALVTNSYFPFAGGAIINTSSYVEFVGLDGLRLHAVLGSGDSLLNVSITVPDTLKGALTGLLGTYNGNIFDDFTPQGGGLILPIDSTSRDIYFNYALTWAVVPTNSLFGAITFVDNPSFSPVFVDEVDFRDLTQFDQSIVEACQSVCAALSIVSACEHDCIFKEDLNQSATYGAAGFTGSLDTLGAATLQCATGSYGAACDACNCPDSPCADGLLGSGVCLE